MRGQLAPPWPSTNDPLAAGVAGAKPRQLHPPRTGQHHDGDAHGNRHFRPHRGAVERLLGAQAQRSLGNFKIGWEKQPASVIRALGIVKRAAAEANMKLKRLDPKLGETIIAAAQEVIDASSTRIPAGRLADGLRHAVQHERQRGDLEPAIEMLGGVMGSKKPVHPNDHVNMSQSSNDTYPTAMHIACAEQISHELIPALKHLHKALARKAKAWDRIIKIGRTHTQDATPVTLGQEFSGYAQQVENGIARIESTLPMLMQLAQGGTAVGTGLNAPVGFAEEVAKRIAKITKLPFTSAPNKFEALAAHDAMVMSHGAINTSRPRCLRSPTTSASSARGLVRASANCRCPRTSPAPRSCRAR